ncbi:MAG: outer membrane protein transport protein [Gammaproteobacteria bacterium]|nr:outer membrane protein transport protein [Gammaproteobacteria bacterium]
MKHTQKILAGALAVALAAPMGAMATNGYFAHGYGQKSKGMGGAGVAYAQDTIAAATNPAGMVYVGNRVDIGLEIFRPSRSSEIVHANGGVAQSLDGDGTTIFAIPEFGYNTMLANNMSFGVTVVGNGGMNTDYKTQVNLFGTTPAGVDLAQMFILPTWAYKINDKNAVGASLILAYQRFEATGLQNFDQVGMTNYVGSVTNVGYDDSTGFGLRIGWTGKINDKLTLGATYASKTKMSEFDKYKGLFAEQGDFDIPANYAIGLAYEVSPKLTVAFDIERILYGDVRAIANNLTDPPPPNLGADNGAGFGWDDMTAFKLGFVYNYRSDLVLRAGFNHGSQPIPESQTFFNILAPGVVEDHLTLGATWTLKNKSELTVHYMHAFEKKLKGSADSVPAEYTGTGTDGQANLKMYQDSVGMAYSWKF